MIGDLIVGVGNTLRGDDGAGVRAAELIGGRCPEVRVITVQGLMPELADLFSTFRRVFLMDASVTATDVRIRRVVAGDTVHQPGAHHLSPETLLAMTALLTGNHVPEMITVEIPAVSMAFGEEITPDVARWITKAVDHVTALVQGRDL